MNGLSSSAGASEAVQAVVEYQHHPPDHAPPAPEEQGEALDGPPSIHQLFEDCLHLPRELADAYARRGLERPYQWQWQCLCVPGVVKEGRNLLYSAPTSGGKSFVADVLLLRRAITTGKKVILVLPFVALVREKIIHLKRILTPYNAQRRKSEKIKIKAFHGSKGGGGLGSSRIAVCTIEKASSLINKLIQDQSIDQVSCIAIDELHLLGDSSRGYLLELLLSKLKFMQGRKISSSSDSSNNNKENAAAAVAAADGGGGGDGSTSNASATSLESLDIQVLGLSATIPNLQEIASWMNAELYVTTFRPVALQEMYHFGDSLYTADGTLVRKLSPNPTRRPEEDPDRLVTLVEETCQKGDQVLVFCHFRKHCETCAKLLADQLLILPVASHIQTKRIAIVKKLSESSTSLHPDLHGCLKKGIAFHHAGLTDLEKDAIEEAFRTGVLSVIVATSTLGTGINLPAARVIFRSLKPGGSRAFEISSYRQMAGRAGRAGQQDYGESILLCKNAAEIKEGTRLMQEALPELQSRLCPEADGGRTLVRAILEMIASGAFNQVADMEQFLNCMLLTRQRSIAEYQSLLEYAQAALRYLIDNRIVEEIRCCQKDGEEEGGEEGEKELTKTMLSPTKLGRALFKSSFAPDEGLVVFEDLKEARKCLVLDGDLHRIYLVSPVFMLKPDFQQLWAVHDRACRHEPVKALIFRLIGLEERLLDRWSRHPPGDVELGRLLVRRKKVPGSTTEGGDASCAAPSTAIKADVLLQGEKLAVLRAHRLWAALALQDLIAEKPFEMIAKVYKVDRGSLQALQQAATSYAGMVKSFLQQLDWSLLMKALDDVVATISGDQGKQLLPLLRIPRLQLSLARALYDSDIKSVEAVASEPEEKLADIIRKNRPFSSGSAAVDSGYAVSSYEDGARRLREAAFAVLAKDDKQRRAKLEELKARWENPGGSRRSRKSSSHGGGGDDDGSSSESEEDGQGGEEDEEEDNDPLLRSAPCLLPLPSSMMPGTTQNMLNTTTAASMRMFETPMELRNPLIRPTDYPRPLCKLTPSRTPSSPDHYLYVPKVSQGDVNSQRQPAKQICLSEQCDTSLRLDFSPKSLGPSAFVSAANPGEFSRLVDRWTTSKCYALVLHFRDLPHVYLNVPATEGRPAHQQNAYHRYMTQTIPSALLGPKQQAAKLLSTHPDEMVILTGVAISFDGRHATYCHLPPPFPTRPFPMDLPIDVHDDGCDSVSSAAKRSSVIDAPLAPPTQHQAVAQYLPGKVLRFIFSFLGYACDHSSGTTTNFSFNRHTEDRRPSHVMNPAFLVCRRWNAYGCEWFNESVSLRGWQCVNWLLAHEGPMKINWDAVTVLAALKERNVDVAGCIEDPKIGLAALLGEKFISKKGTLLRLMLPNCTTRLDALCYQAAGLLQVAGAVEEGLSSQHLLQPFRFIEMPLTPVLAEMAFYGIRVDRGWFPSMLSAIQQRLLLLQDLADSYTDCHLNLNCDDAIHHLLYTVLKLTPPARWSKKTNVFGNHAEVGGKTLIGPTQTHWLETMVHLSPAVKVILDWRRLVKAMRVLRKLRNSAHLQPLVGSHRICSRVEQCGTVTGRMTMSDPPIQQVSHDFTLKQVLRPSIQDEIEGHAQIVGGSAAAADVPALSPPSVPPSLFTDVVPSSLSWGGGGMIVDDGHGDGLHQQHGGQGSSAAGAAAGGSSQQKQDNANGGNEGFPVTAIRTDSFFCQDSHMTAQIGILRCILSSRVADPFLLQKHVAFSAPAAFTLVDVHELVQSKETLAAYWYQRGYEYSDDDAKRVRQVLVEFPVTHTLLTYPADKVFRRALRRGEDPESLANKAFAEDVPEILVSPRNAFPAARGFLLISADYSQIELRILAHFSSDPLLISTLGRNEDVFKSLAATWKGISETEVTKEARDEAKQLAYGILYGQSITSTAQTMNITTTQADKLQSSFLATYPGIRTFVRSCRDFCHQHGYVETLLGRRRYLPGIHSKDASERSQAERQAVNSICQGSAADLMKLAMVNIHHQIGDVLLLQAKMDRSRKTTASSGSSSGTTTHQQWPLAEDGGGSLGIKPCRLVLQIHDELIYEVREDLVGQAVGLIKQCMEEAVKLKVPLRVNIKKGARWGVLLSV